MGSWIELPGLFEASELDGVTDLEVRAKPLVIVDSRVLYGVYVRECNDVYEAEVSTVRKIEPGIVSRPRTQTG